MNALLSRLQHIIIVSSQATQGEPLNTPEILCALAESACRGGAGAIRMAQVENIRHFREQHPDVPLIGITKPPVIPENAHEIVYITPTFQALQSIAPYCDIVALDTTRRPRPNGETLEAIVQATRRDYPNLLLMADIATLEDGMHAEKLGFDLIGTTLSGYTEETRACKNEGPDFELLRRLRDRIRTPVILEGRIWQPEEVAHAFHDGAYAVVIGSAVTRPHEITRRFVQAIPANTV